MSDSWGCDVEPGALFLNPDAEPVERARDLVRRLTLDEKSALIGEDAPAVPRLGLNAYNWWNECLHGVGRAGKATVFPQAIGMAATWNTELMFRIGTAISDEARAKHHAALRQGNRTINLGLTYWSPTINILRDARWGRAQETYGEDPYLSGSLAVQFIKGLQGDDPKYLKVVGTAKHYAAHNGPENGRFAFDAQVGIRDMVETYLPAFKMCVQEAGCGSVMGAYNRLNGTPCCADRWLLWDVLRDQWGFNGFVVSDCGAVENQANAHKWAKSVADAAAKSVQAGCDVCCGQAYNDLPKAVREGLIQEAEIDAAFVRAFSLRFQLGMFDDEAKFPYSTIPESVVESPEHRAMARQAAVESMVLLENQDGFLPISKKTNVMMLTGPNADAVDVLLGNYSGHSGSLVTFLEGIVEAASIGSRVIHAQGCALVGPAPEGNPYSMVGWEGRRCDVLIACMGLSPKMEGEEGDESLGLGDGDRHVTDLPPSQVHFLKYLDAMNKPIILVLTGGSPITLPVGLKNVKAVIMAWYPGCEGGNALADLIFGDRAFSGRLPVTFPDPGQTLPPISDYSMNDRTYKFMRHEPKYAFGYGLSTTAFEYSGLEVTGLAPQNMRVSVRVKNSGPRDGVEVVQVYLRDLEATTRVPKHKLVAYASVPLAAGESKEVALDVRPDSFLLVDEDGVERFEPGEFELFVGGCQPLQRHIGSGEVLSARLSTT